MACGRAMVECTHCAYIKVQYTHVYYGMDIRGRWRRNIPLPVPTTTTAKRQRYKTETALETKRQQEHRIVANVHIETSRQWEENYSRLGILLGKFCVQRFKLIIMWSISLENLYFGLDNRLLFCCLYATRIWTNFCCK